jgi:adenylate kinase family enzyme
MIDAIFDIADEAYIHLQKQDAGGIDDRNWHEWKQLFVEGVDISAGATVAEPSTDAETAATAPLDKLEMVDYLENKGQWPPGLVTDSKPKLADLLGGGDAAAAGGKPAKGKAAAPVEAALDEADMVIDDAPANNYYVGDAVEQIININYEARGRQLRPRNPHYLNLKLCLVGYAFSGKKYQAAELQKKYGLEVLQLTDLVEEAVKFYEANPNPIPKEPAEVDATKPSHETIHEESVEAEAPVEEKPAEDAEAEKADEPPAEGQDEQPPAEEEKPKVLGQNPMFTRADAFTASNEEEAKSEASELDEELHPKEDFRACGQRIQEWLYAGGEIPDQLYVDLFIAKLRMTYEIKDRATLKGKLMEDARREMTLRKELVKLGAEKGELKAAAAKDTSKRKKKRTVEVVEMEIQARKDEIMKIMTVENTGWVLIDFPANFGQAMLLEKALSGYNIPADLKPTTREDECKEATLLVKPTEKPEPPKTLIPSGMDAVIWFDCERDECLRRALGRRVDPGTGMRYHIED